MMHERLIKEHGVSEDRFGHFHVYATTKEHRDAIREAGTPLTPAGKERLHYKNQRDEIAEIRYLADLRDLRSRKAVTDKQSKALCEKWQREVMDSRKK